MYESILREATSFADKDVLLAITLSNMGSIYYKKVNISKRKILFR